MRARPDEAYTSRRAPAVRAESCSCNFQVKIPVQITRIKAGLFGQPLSGSLSPDIFRLFAGLTGTGISYEPRETPASGLAEGIASAKAEGWSGFNVTIPHKAAVCALLASADDAVRAAGAANCVRFGTAGPEGVNTDAAALNEIFKEKGITPSGKKAAIFGSGGAAAAAGWALGSSGASETVFLSRNPAKGAALARRLGPCFPKTLFSAAPFAAPSGDTGTIINATPLGMYGPGTPPFAPRHGTSCLDMAYSAHGTEFIKAAAAGGAVTVDGLEILVWQAALSLRFWTGLPAGDIVELKREALRLLRGSL